MSCAKTAEKMINFLFGLWLGWAEASTVQSYLPGGARQPGEHNWTIHLRQRCGYVKLLWPLVLDWPATVQCVFLVGESTEDSWSCWELCCSQQNWWMAANFAEVNVLFNHAPLTSLR